MEQWSMLLGLVFMTPQNILFHNFETLAGTRTLQLCVLEGLRFRIAGALQSDVAGVDYGRAAAAAMDSHEAETKVLYDSLAGTGECRSNPD